VDICQIFYAICASGLSVCQTKLMYLRSVDVRLPFSCGGISNDWSLLMDTQLGSGGLDL